MRCQLSPRSVLRNTPKLVPANSVLSASYAGEGDTLWAGTGLGPGSQAKGCQLSSGVPRMPWRVPAMTA